jgi:hypothetical protein
MTFSQGHCEYRPPSLKPIQGTRCREGEIRLTQKTTPSSSSGEKAEEAHGDKRKPEDFDRWRGLAKIGGPKERHTIMEQATLEVIEDGRPDYMGDIEDDAETL